MITSIPQMLQEENLQDVSMLPCYKNTIIHHTPSIVQSFNSSTKDQQIKYNIGSCPNSTLTSSDEKVTSNSSKPSQRLVINTIRPTKPDYIRSDVLPNPTKSTISVNIETSTLTTAPSTTNQSNTDTSQQFATNHSISSSLTPSQRLRLRKLQISDSINKLKIEDNDINNHENIEDDDDLDLSLDIINIPVSRLLKPKRKCGIANYDRTNSLTNSTRSNSILSNGSYDTTSSLSEISLNFSNNSQTGKKERDLILFCNQNEFDMIHEQSQKHRKLLKDFKEVDVEHLRHKPTLEQKSLRQDSAAHSIPRPSLPPSNSTASKYYSFTRPFWLPPKANSEKTKHQNLSESVIKQALLKESKEQAAKLANIESLKLMKHNDVTKWKAMLRLNNDEYCTRTNPISPEVVEMYWRGISYEVRPKVWWKHYYSKRRDSNAQFNEKFCDHYFDLYDGIFYPNIRLLEKLIDETRQIKVAIKQYIENMTDNPKIFQQRQSVLKKLQLQRDQSDEKIIQFLAIKVRSMELSEIKFLYDKIVSDLIELYPDNEYFDNPIVVQKLTKIIVCFVLYMYDSLRMTETTKLGDYYYSGLSATVAVYYYNFRNSYKTLVQMCHFSHRHLISLLLPYRMMNMQTPDGSNDLTYISKAIIGNSINDFFVKKFEMCFKNHLNRVYIHFKVIDLKPLEYLSNLILSFLSNVCSFEVTCHLIDVLTFNNDFTGVFCKFILGLFKRISHKLFGSKQEILDLLLMNVDMGINLESDKKNNYLDIGYDYQFIDAVRSIIV